MAPAGAGQMVSFPSCCFSDIPSPNVQPACSNYLSLPYAQLMSDGAACLQILEMEITHFVLDGFCLCIFYADVY